MSAKQEFLAPGQYYHIFNKTVGGELLFKHDENYKYFLDKCKKYISPYAEILAYCLMPTHFHFLLRPCQGEEPYEGSKPNQPQEGSKTHQPCEGSKPLVGLSTQLSHLFNSYAQAYNKQNNRCGSLFKNRFKRVIIADETHIRNVIIYIHLNPTHHKIETDFINWKYSSYTAISGIQKTIIARDKVLQLFQNRENFIFCHNEKCEIDSGLSFE